MERVIMKKLTGIREDIDALTDEANPCGFLQVSHEELSYLLKKEKENNLIKQKDTTVYQNVFENLKGETNAHWLCVALNDKLNEMHSILPEIAHAMRLNLDDVDREKRESLEELIEFTDDLAEHIRVEQCRHIDKMREFSGLREYGKGMKL
jgi:hypothetical protein